MNGGNNCRVAAAAAWVIFGLWLTAAAADNEPDPKREEPRPAPRAASQVVHFRAESAEDLKHAARHVRNGDWDLAVSIYEGLLREERSMVCPLGGGRFMPIVELVQQEIGRLPPEGMKFYRTRVDAESRALMEHARAGDAAALNRLTAEFRHSAVGPDAIELAAHRAFDAGDFFRAARLFGRRADDYPAAKPAKALFLLKRALALHESGRAAEAEAVLRRMQEETPGEFLTIAGRRASAEGWLEQVLKPGGTPDRRRDGLPADLQVSLRPRWSLKSGKAAASFPETAVIDGPVSVARLRFANRLVGQAEGELPRSAHPVPAVMGDTAFVRTSNQLRAVNLRAGREIWSVPAPLLRRASGADTAVDPALGDAWAVDLGRLGVSADGGLVYCIEGYPDASLLYDDGGDPNADKGRKAGNRLIARSAADGSLVWDIGYSALPATQRKPPARKPPAEHAALLAAATYLSAPAVSHGRLYLLAEYQENYHALCLEARTGDLIWVRPLSARPPQSFGWPTPATAPSVADGVVYCLTNAGTLAALDAGDGDMFWLFQYGDGLGSRPADAPFPDDGAPHALRPPNPVFVSAGTVLALPADSDRVLALRADTGEPAWKEPRPRDGQNYLLGSAGGSVVLGGPDALLLNPADGRVSGKVAIGAAGGGRPALTRSAMYIPVEGGAGKRGVVRVGFAGGKAAVQDLPLDPSVGKDLVLGNLTVAGGRLLSASEHQLHAFFDLDEELKRLTAELAAAPDDPQILLDRGGLALAAGRLAEAERDLLAARDAAGAAGDWDQFVSAESGLFDIGFARADAADDPAVRRRLVLGAAAFGSDPPRSAAVRMELARIARDEGTPAGRTRAADIAQELIAGPDVAFDPSDRAARRTRSKLADVALASSHAEAHALVGALIAAHGQSLYERHNRAAEAALDKFSAARSVEGLEDVLRTYPHGDQAGRALVEIGMAYARLAEAEAGTAGRAATEARLRQAHDHLKQALDPKYDGSPWRASAIAGLADVSRRPPWRYLPAARAFLKRLDSFPPDTPLYWPDGKRRTLAEALPEMRQSLGLPPKSR